jgi:NADH:ubiquinone oxidoreductase subunit
MTVTTRLYTFFHGQLVGEDQFGNRYYTEKKPKDRRQTRWVMYKGLAEPSKVPPEWHGWLHYTLDTPPNELSITRHSWQKPHLPNLTGTKGAYVPPGHLLRGAQRAATTSDYEAWKP